MRRWGEAGVTLPEVLVAMLLIGIALVPLLQLYPATIDAGRASEVNTILSAAAVRKAEEVISIIRAPSGSPVQHDNSIGYAAGFVSSSSATLTIGASANYVLIIVGTVNAYAVSSVTVGGVAATRITFLNHTSNALRGELWGLLNPPTGSRTVTVTLSSAMYHSWVAASFSNVLSATPLGNTATNQATSSTPSAAVSSRTANSLMAGGFTFRTSISYTIGQGAGQTAVSTYTATAALTHMARETSAGSAGVDMNWTVTYFGSPQSNYWVALITELRGGGGGGAGSTSGTAACAEYPDCRLVWTTITELSSGTAGVGELDQVNVVACRDTNASMTCDSGEPQVRYDTKVTTRP